MSLNELEDIVIEPNEKIRGEKGNKDRIFSSILLEITQVKNNLSLIQKIKFNIFGVVKIEKGKYLKKCHDCGDICLTSDPDDYYCPES